ncbi:MAG: YqgE/AlgH family protein [Alphaproteobacteria bacterium]|nr:YqgE/AlgH family protein [Alphaproteobacteria bacterium]
MSFLTGKFLISTPTIDDGPFKKSVIYICLHNQEGAMGLMFSSKLSHFTFENLLQQLNIIKNKYPKTITLLSGGPVDPSRGFVIHSPEFKTKTSVHIEPDMSFSLSTEVIKAIAENNGPEKFSIFLGYSAWKAGQLENEIKENYWLIADLSSNFIFDIPVEKRWDYAYKCINIAPINLSRKQGNT